MITRYSYSVKLKLNLRMVDFSKKCCLIVLLCLLSSCFKKREEPGFTSIAGTYNVLSRQYYNSATGMRVDIKEVPVAYSSSFKDSLDNISFITIKADGLYNWFEYYKGAKVLNTKGTIKNINSRQSLSGKSYENNYPYIVKTSGGGLQIRMDFKGTNSEELNFKTFLEPK